MDPTMTPMTPEEMKALRDSVLRLAETCPVELTNPADCPLYGVRKLKPARRLRWFDDLTGDDLAYLNGYHCICAQIKTESRLHTSALRLYDRDDRLVDGDEKV
jgi:hypothetical protein